MHLLPLATVVLFINIDMVVFYYLTIIRRRRREVGNSLFREPEVNNSYYIFSIYYT